MSFVMLISADFWLLSVTTISGWSASICLRIWMKSPTTYWPYSLWFFEESAPHLWGSKPCTDFGVGNITYLVMILYPITMSDSLWCFSAKSASLVLCGMIASLSLFFCCYNRINSFFNFCGWYPEPQVYQRSGRLRQSR